MEEKINNFSNFINSLSKEEKKNFFDFSKMRGVQQYRIIFECLKTFDANVKYNDVNAFIRYDKAIKDVLFKYLGSLEEYIRNKIIIKFDFDYSYKIELKEYHRIDKLPVCIKKDQSADEITNFYRCFALNFGDLVSFIKTNCPHDFDAERLEIIVRLRNKVMHHKPLLFDCDFKSTRALTEEGITNLINLLPDQYSEFLIQSLNEITKLTKNNIKNVYKDLCLKIF